MKWWFIVLAIIAYLVGAFIAAFIRVWLQTHGWWPGY